MKAEIKQGKRRVRVSMSIHEAKIVKKFLGHTKMEDIKCVIDKHGLDLDSRETDGVFDDLYNEIDRIITEEEEQ